MTNEQQNGWQDQAHTDAVKFSLGFGGEHMTDTMWRCDALRAGKLYSRSLFGTKAEADEFARQLAQHEPDQMFKVEAIKASSVWN